MKDTAIRALRYGPRDRCDAQSPYTIQSCYSTCQNIGFKYFSLQADAIPNHFI